jgi:ABC-2 type transport system permease protein
VTYQLVDPSNDAELADQIVNSYGFRPLAVDLFSAKQFWCYLLVQSGGKSYPIFPQGEPTEGYLRTILEAGVRRMTPGYLKTIGLITKSVQQQKQVIPGVQSKPPVTDYRALEAVLKEEFDLRRIRVDEGVVPGDIDVLIIGKLGPLTDKMQFAIDQYLMRGGAVIAFAGMYSVKPQYGALNAEREADSLFDLLETYGVEVEQGFAMDSQNSPFPIPVRERRGAVYMNRIELVPYPFFPDIRQSGLNGEHFSSKGIQSMSLNWASPVWLEGTKDDDGTLQLDDRGLPVINAAEGVEAEYIAWTTHKGWVKRDTGLEPDFRTFPGKGFGVPKGEPLSRVPLAVTMTGTFRSYFAERPSPLFAGSDKEDAELGDRTGRTIKSSTPEARLAVVGSSDFTGDLVAQLGSQMGGGAFRGNLVFVRNLVDWALEDTDMLSIRSAGAFARTLKPMEDNERSRYELINYVLVMLGLIAVLGLTVTRRRLTRPIPLGITDGDDS